MKKLLMEKDSAENAGEIFGEEATTKKKKRFFFFLAPLILFKDFLTCIVVNIN